MGHPHLARSQAPSRAARAKEEFDAAVAAYQKKQGARKLREALMAALDALDGAECE